MIPRSQEGSEQHLSVNLRLRQPGDLRHAISDFLARRMPRKPATIHKTARMLQLVGRVLASFQESQRVRGPVVLLQQPEIHLHPQAQAAVGTFIAKLVATKHCRLVVETHSDYLVDRIRREVAQGVLGARDVEVLFCERSAKGSKFGSSLQKAPAF